MKPTLSVTGPGWFPDVEEQSQLVLVLVLEPLAELHEVESSLDQTPTVESTVSLQAVKRKPLDEAILVTDPHLLKTMLEYSPESILLTPSSLPILPDNQQSLPGLPLPLSGQLHLPLSQLLIPMLVSLLEISLLMAVTTVSRQDFELLATA